MPRKLISFLLVLLFIITTPASIAQAANPNNVSPTEPTASPGVSYEWQINDENSTDDYVPPEESFLDIWWDRYNHTYGEHWDWKEVAWEFGPKMKLEIFFLDNETPIEPGDWVPLEEYIQINVTIPKSLLEDRSLYSVTVEFQTWQENFSAGIFIQHDRFGWSTYSYLNNYTSGEYLNPYLFHLDTSISLNETTEDQYIISFVGYFTADTPIWTYDVRTYAYDSEGNSYSLDTRFSDYMGWVIGIGAPIDEIKKRGQFYSFEKLNELGESVYYISLNQKIILRVNLTDENFDNVSIGFEFPVEYVKKVQETDWHMERVNITGGWVYNATTDTYVWDPNATVLAYKWVYGPCTKEIYIWRTIEVNTTEWIYDFGNETYYLENKTIQVFPQFWLIYDKKTDTFKTMIRYHYMKANESVPGLNYDILVYKNISELPEEYNIFTLLENESYTVYSNGIYSIVFTGYFTDYMTPGLVNFYVVPIGTKGKFFEPDPIMYANDPNPYRLSVGKPIFIVDVVGFDYWAYANPGESIMMVGKLPGGAEFFDAIDGIRLVLRGYDYKWTSTEHRYSELEIILTIDFNSGEIDQKTYNRTYKESYEYGQYWVWDPETHKDELVEGWHWEYYVYNQTGEYWMQEYPDPYDNDFLVNKSYLQVNYWNKILNEVGDPVFILNVTLSMDMPEQVYDLWVDLLDLVYGPDPFAPEGEYKVFEWVEEIIYSFEDQSGEKIYMEHVSKFKKAIFDNGEIHRIESRPYVIINRTHYTIKYEEFYDPVDGKYIKIVLFGEPPKQYYIMENGTKLFLNSSQYVYIYRVDLTSLGISIETINDYPYYNSFINKLYWILTNGSLYFAPEGIEFNVTRVNKTEVEYASYQIMYIKNGTELVKTATWINWDGLNETYYVILDNGTRLNLRYDSDLCYYYYETDAGKYYVTYPDDAFEGIDNSTNVLAPYPQVRRMYYTTIEGKIYEMPYPGAEAWDTYQLSRTEVDGGLVPLEDFVEVNDSWYVIHQGEPDYVIINGTRYNLTIMDDYGCFINHKFYWLRPLSRKVPLLTYDDVGLPNASNYIYVIPSTEYWDSPYFLTNGTSIPTYGMTQIYIYELNVSGEIILATNEYPEYNDTLGKYYFKDLNYTIHYIESFEEFTRVKVHVILVNDSTGLFEIYGTIYNITELKNNGYCFREEYVNTIFIGGKRYTIDREANWIYKFNVTYKMKNYTAEGKLEWIYKRIKIFGRPYLWHLDLMKNFTTSMTTNQLIVGMPERGMWDLHKWKIDPETGALDLDGDLTTEYDRFYVKRVYYGSYDWNSSVQGLSVWGLWDPNTTIPENELQFSSWMGLEVFSWMYTWNETFYWYYASNRSFVSEKDWEWINSTIWDESTGKPKPGYWSIAWMTKNMSWTDIIDKARKEGWDWIEDNVQTWTWLWFGFEENYWASYEGENRTQSAQIRLRYEFAGMFIYRDLNNNGMMDINATEWGVDPTNSEATHYFIFDRVDAVEFYTPGVEYGNYNDTGNLHLNGTDPVLFGVRYENLTGTTYPFNGRSYWWWYAGELVGEEFDTFDDRPVKNNVSELLFKVHFWGNDTEENGTYKAYFKLDQYVGDWEPDIAGGRSVLENRSLSLNYYIFLETDTSWSVYAGDRDITREDIVEASTFRIGTDKDRFAEILISPTYLWGRNLTIQNVSSHTVPIATFQSIYIDYGSNNTAAGWSWRSDMYFLSIGFTKWDGYFVHQDPEVVSYISRNLRTGFDVNPPEVEMLTSTEEVYYDQDCVIRIRAYDESGIESAILRYEYDGNYYEVPMSSVGEDIYEGIIPRLPYGTTVKYQIIVEDTVGNVYESPEYMYTVGDPYPPQIQNIHWSYDEDQAQLVITADVYEPEDASGVKLVKVLYTYKGISLEAEMTYNGTTYVATIDLSSGVSPLKFKVYAEDYAGNFIYSQETNLFGGEGPTFEFYIMITIVIGAAAGAVGLILLRRKRR